MTGGSGDPNDPRALLVLQATSAHRDRDADGRIRFHPAWWDLSEEDRQWAFKETEALRAMEAALDDDGLSTTARAVLARLPRD